MVESSLVPTRGEKTRRGLSGPSLAAESVGRTKADLLRFVGLSVVVKGNPPTHFKTSSSDGVFYFVLTSFYE
jgi:hypothetical protein